MARSSGANSTAHTPRLWPRSTVTCGNESGCILNVRAINGIQCSFVADFLPEDRQPKHDASPCTRAPFHAPAP